MKRSKAIMAAVIGVVLAPSAAAAADGPPTVAQCQAAFGAACYGAPVIRHVYGMDGLGGVDGQGATVALLSRYSVPSLQHDMDTYSAGFGLPNTNVEIVEHGNVPPYDPSNDAQLSDEMEITLDAEMVHSMAPKAHIIVVETGPDASASGDGQGNQLNAISWLVANRKVDVVSMSFGVAEDDYAALAGTPGDYHLLTDLRSGLQAAAKHNVTVVASNGDQGPTTYKPDGSYYETTEAEWPASDPLVTAVGGTQLHITDQGERTAPDTVWNDNDLGKGATGGAPSRVFARPAWQPAEAGMGDHRASTDIALDGSGRSRVLMYASNQLAGTKVGNWGALAGTSVSTPLFAGMVADAVQAAGHRLGNINPTLYGIPRGASTGLADVTEGCNTWKTVTGFCATAGPDSVSGVGTPGNAAKLLPLLNRS